MKTLKILFVFALLFAVGRPATAQVNVNVNMGAPQYRQPIYHEVADYYYLPDYGVYYNVNRKMYFYPEHGRWVYARRLPKRYGFHHDWRRTHFVRMHERAPFFRNDYYHRKYSAQKPQYRKGKQYGHGHYDRRDKHYDRRDNRYDRGAHKGQGNGRSHGRDNHPGRR